MDPTSLLVLVRECSLVKYAGRSTVSLEITRNGFPETRGFALRLLDVGEALFGIRVERRILKSVAPGLEVPR